MITICHGQINEGNICQEMYEETYRGASWDAERRVAQLEAAGYEVRSYLSVGKQVTVNGLRRMAIVVVLPGRHAHTFGLPTENWTLEPTVEWDVE